MGQTASEELFSLQVTCGTCSGVAILTTLVRISVRMRRQSRFWVDDALAMFSAAALITQFVAVNLDPAHHNGIVRYYLISNMFYATIWSARLSILFSLVRITQNLHSNRAYYVFAALFLVTWLVLTAQLFWECESKSAWKHMENPQCDLSIAVAICQIVADAVSDSVLLVAPIRMFMVITDRKVRYRAIIIFSTCIVTTIVSLVHAVYIFKSKSLPILITAVIENAVALIVCNVPVVVMALVKIHERRHTRVSVNSAAVPNFRNSTSTEQSVTLMAEGEATILAGRRSKSVSTMVSTVASK